MAQEKKKYMPIWIWIIVWAFVIGTIFNFVWPFLSKDSSPAFYVKDNNLYVLPEGKETSFDIENVSLENVMEQTKNGSRIAFLDSNSNLYIREISASKENEKIDENVSSFSFYNNQSDVVYLKQGEMWLYSNKIYRQLDSSVSSFVISNDKKKIIYEKEGGSYYIIGFKNEDIPEQYTMAGDTDIISNPGEYKKFIYVQGGEIYEKDYGKDVVTAAESVDSAFMLGKTIYYFKDNNGVSNLYEVTKTGEQEISNDIESTLTNPIGKTVLLQSKVNDIYVLQEGKTPFLAFNKDEATSPQLSSDGKNLYALTNAGDNYNLIDKKIGNGKISSEKTILGNEEIYTYWLDNDKVFISTGTADQQGLGVYGNSKYKQLTQSGYLLGNLKTGIYYIDETNLNKYYLGSTKKIDSQINNYGFFGEDLLYTKDQTLYWLKNNKSVEIDTGVTQFIFPTVF